MARSPTFTVGMWREGPGLRDTTIVPEGAQVHNSQQLSVSTQFDGFANALFEAFRVSASCVL
jgi:hypothetical protein